MDIITSNLSGKQKPIPKTSAKLGVSSCKTTFVARSGRDAQSYIYIKGARPVKNMVD